MLNLRKVNKYRILEVQIFRLIYLMVLAIIFTFQGDLFGHSLPTGHWAYDSIRKIQILGGFQELPNGSIPYSRMDIARGLIQIKQDKSAKIIKLHPEYFRLLHEFELEIGQYSELLPQASNEFIYTDLRLLSITALGSHPQFSMQARVNYTIFSHVSLQYGAIVTQTLINDPNYWGYEWRGLAGYQDQLFILFNNKYLKTMLGRDYIVWGYGHGGGLFITDNSRPFDMLKLAISGKKFRIESFVAQLDQLSDANRYLTATRLAIDLQRHITIGFGQSALYGGINRVLDFTLSNPLAFYSFSQDNDSKHMNMMLYSDFAMTVKPGFRIYSELLIDDFQIDQEEQSDLEPNEIALMIGGEAVQVLNRFDIWVEFTQVRNRTYNVPNMRPWEKFIHRGRPIAHPEGTDFQLFAAHSDVWLNPGLQSYMEVSILKKGEGTITGDFTEPWMASDVSLDSGYSEKIPTGIIESTSCVKVGLKYIPSKSIILDLSIGYQDIKNAFNINEENSSGINASVKLVVDYDKLSGAL